MKCLSHKKVVSIYRPAKKTSINVIANTDRFTTITLEFFCKSHGQNTFDLQIQNPFLLSAFALVQAPGASPLFSRKPQVLVTTYAP